MFADVVAPTLIPRKAGDRVKNDRRDGPFVNVQADEEAMIGHGSPRSVPEDRRRGRRRPR